MGGIWEEGNGRERKHVDRTIRSVTYLDHREGEEEEGEGEGEEELETFFAVWGNKYMCFCLIALE